jgi:hypothetical protein
MHLEISELALPETSALVCRTVNVERKNLAFGKVVFEELMDTHGGVVNWTSGASLSERSQNAGGTETVTARCLHGLPLGEKADGTL